MNGSLLPSLPTKILLILLKTVEEQKLNFCGNALFHMKTRVRDNSVNHCLWKKLLAFKSTQTCSNLISLKILVILTSVTRWQKCLPSKVNFSASWKINCSNFMLKLCERPWNYNNFD